MKWCRHAVLIALCAILAATTACRRPPILMQSGMIHVDDGDTIHYGEDVFRVVGIDTPEIRHDEHGFFEDQPFGREAKRATEEIIGGARRIEYLPCGTDRYGRTLVHLFVDGELLAVRLIRAGLAYETVTYYGDNGYPELADLILNAVNESPKPEFEPPWKWKKRQRER